MVETKMPSGGRAAGANIFISRLIGNATWASLGVVLTLLFMAGASFWSIERLNSQAEMVLHSELALDELDGLIGRVTDVETALRGYLLSQDETYLRPYDAAAPAVAIHLRTLDGMLRTDSSQQARLARVKKLASMRIGEARTLVETARGTGFDAARRQFAGGEGRRLHDQIRALITTMRKQEANLVATGQAGLQRAVKQTTTLVICFFLLIGVAFFIAKRSSSAARGAEHERRVSDARYRQITEASPDLIIVSSNDEIVFANPRAEDFLKGSAGDILGRSPSGIFEREDSPFLNNELPKLLEEPGISRSLRETIRALDGSTFEAEVRGASYHDGTDMHVLIKCRDVTDSLALEKQLQQAQRLESLGKLTGGVAHDFNNILTVILGSSEALSEAFEARTEDQHLRELSEMICHAAEQGASLTGHLLAFARRQPLDPKPVDITGLIDEMTPLLSRTLGEDVELVIHREAEASRALVDPSQLESAILNLCLNARDAMAGGMLTIEAANVKLDETYASWNQDVVPGPYVRLSVSDTGTGIAPEILEKVFEPFFTTKAVGEGSGLGLSMVYGFLKQTGGHAKIYSELGHGTTVKLYLPRARDDDPVAPSVSTRASPAIGGSEQVLLVEDDPLVCTHVSAQLKSLGYAVTSASSAREALEALHSQRFALLFTDIVMPGGMNGRQLADEARKVQPDIAVLFTSGYTENAIVHHGRLDPGVRLLQKPYRKMELAHALRGALDR